MITDEFAPLLVRTINDLSANPVHLLFNQWWNRSTPDAVEAYTSQLLADPAFAAFVERGTYAEPLDLGGLAAMADGTLGRAYRDWIVENGLTAQIAMDYRAFHRALVDRGMLDGMPEQLQYAVLRGFQLHDFLHVLTGYDATPLGELALQAFSLAQLQFPYFAMWMAVSTARMTFVQPSSIVPLMDALAAGWQHGRRTPQISLHPWEDELERPLDELRAEWGIEPVRG